MAAREPKRAPRIQLGPPLEHVEPVKPSTPEQNEAYFNGICTACLTEPRRAGSTQCEGCYNFRLKGIRK